MIRKPQTAMAIARNFKPKSSALKTFHATMLVTRAEEWWVEADSLDRAQALFASGEGHRASVGECVHVEVERIFDVVGD